MNCYGPLASWYDQLTQDVRYEDFLAFYEARFARGGGEFKTVLDLCCGTGTLTCMMAEKGYEMIAADASADMLAEAYNKAMTLDAPPLFLCQEASELDLYGTVDAAVCSLDGMNYIEPGKIPEVFRRLHLFVRPGGLVIFDVRLPEWFRSLDGEIFADENDDVLCLWRASFDETENAMIYGMDIFSRRGKLWERGSEEHIEYAHEPETLKTLLLNAGFTDVELCRDCPQGNDGRMFICAKRN